MSRVSKASMARTWAANHTHSVGSSRLPMRLAAVSRAELLVFTVLAFRETVSRVRLGAFCLEQNRLGILNSYVVTVFAMSD
jgi:hypothetical protein